ncbi:hypothetical protein SAMN05444172_2613 [Burkholderia sp. GAS332]|nr:hypothetical protein SAMN05444172_2613 [Burkholderia sp. GAS332]
MKVRLALHRVPGDNALLRRCVPGLRSAITTVIAYGVAAGGFLYLVVALAAGGAA